MFNKRGQELSTGTIILLIIGVIILVLLALGFTSGWGKVFPFISQTNVESVRTACSSICTDGSAEQYCLATRDLIPSKGEPKIKDATCYYLARREIIPGCGIDCSKKVNLIEDVTPLVKISVTYASLIETCLKQKTDNPADFSKWTFNGTSLQTLAQESTNSHKLVSYACPAAK